MKTSGSTLSGSHSSVSGKPVDPLAIDLTAIEQIQAMILGWYAVHARRFLWRVPDPGPYLVLVSETMLQQTQTSRVQEKLPTFLARFPGFRELAEADNATIIRAWQGMGYNNRAIRLRDCARVVMDRYHGKLPETAEELASLPGVGPYTVAAILAFAFHRDVVVLDVNVRRLYSRMLLRLSKTTDTMAEPLLQHVAREIYPRGRSSEWHQACMDIAALYCTARSPQCLFCPVTRACRSSFHLVDALPPKVAEPSFRGQPNRIWRGRIIELLRGIKPGETLPIDQLQAELLPGSGTQELTWLTSILTALERDQLIQRDPSTGGVCLRS